MGSALVGLVLWCLILWPYKGRYMARVSGNPEPTKTAKKDSPMWEQDIPWVLGLEDDL